MVDKDAVRRGYDALAETYAANRSESGRDVDILDRFLGSLSTPARILDAGCGPGTPVLRRLCTFATAIGVDVSRGQLDVAAGNVPGTVLVQGDMTRLPIRDGVFDAVTAYHSLIHVPIDGHQTVLDEFARVLRPGGRLLLTEAVDEWRGTNPDWLGSGVEMQWNIAGAEATRKQLRNAGFTIVDEWGDTDAAAEDDERWVFFSTQLGR